MSFIIWWSEKTKESNIFKIFHWYDEEKYLKFLVLRIVEIPFHWNNFIPKRILIVQQRKTENHSVSWLLYPYYSSNEILRNAEKLTWNHFVFGCIVFFVQRNKFHVLLIWSHCLGAFFEANIKLVLFLAYHIKIRNIITDWHPTFFLLIT